jgi:two-component system sensor histidine kinase RegB
MPEQPQASATPAERSNLQRLFVLRNIAIMGQIVAVYVAHVHLGMRIPVVSLGMIIGLLFVFNVFTRMRLKWGGAISAIEFLLQLTVDVLALTALLYQTGGASNPFVLMFLMPIILATVVLPGRFIWVLTMITAAAYSFLMWKYIPLPHAHGDHDGFSLHVFGMWLAFVISAAVTAYFVVGMRRTLRDKDQALTAAREKQLRDEQLVVLGTLAASTAHELGTPLGTMSLISEELEHDMQDAAGRQQLALLRQQIERCKQALSSLSASAGSVKLSGGEVLPVSHYLQSVLDEWQRVRPYSKLTTDWHGIHSNACVLSDRTLNQALINILDNAADASTDNIEWISHWDAHELVMDIKDRGQGLSEEASAIIGKQPYTAKSDGLGLGLFLSHSIISRFGGQVKLYNRKGGGVTTHITLPLTSADMLAGS